MSTKIAIKKDKTPTVEEQLEVLWEIVQQLRTNGTQLPQNGMDMLDMLHSLNKEST
jgi:hypothetical protein